MEQERAQPCREGSRDRACSACDARVGQQDENDVLGDEVGTQGAFVLRAGDQPLDGFVGPATVPLAGERGRECGGEDVGEPAVDELHVHHLVQEAA